MSSKINNNNKTKSLTPPHVWVGGKRKEIKWVKKHMPDAFDIYCEPFFGGGAVYCKLGINKPAILNDCNEHVVAFLKSIQQGKFLKIKKTLAKCR